MHHKLRYSLKDRINSTVIISMNKKDGSPSSDSFPVRLEKRVDGNNKIFQFLYGVDSLQDSLKIPEITLAYQKRIEREALPVPFSVTRLNKSTETEDLDFADITVGFAHPITYHLELGNTFPYLVKRITLPILFSIFLVGFTILSFIML